VTTAVPQREVERATLLHGLLRSAAHLASELCDLSSALSDLLRLPDDVLLSFRPLHARPRVGRPSPADAGILLNFPARIHSRRVRLSQAAYRTLRASRTP